MGVALLGSMPLQACSPTFVRPTIYPNEHLKQVGDAQFERDLNECNDLATTYASDKNRYDDLARQSLGGAAIGSASGAVGGAILGGKIGRSVAAGAAIGAIIPLLHQMFRSDDAASPNREKFVSYCLQDRGYKVL